MVTIKVIKSNVAFECPKKTLLSLQKSSDSKKYNQLYITVLNESILLKI